EIALCFPDISRGFRHCRYAAVAKCLQGLFVCSLPRYNPCHRRRAEEQALQAFSNSSIPAMPKSARDVRKTLGDFSGSFIADRKSRIASPKLSPGVRVTTQLNPTLVTSLLSIRGESRP